MVKYRRHIGATLATNISMDYQVYCRMSVEYRPRETYYKYGKVSAECRPSIGRLSMTGEVSTDISVKNCLPLSTAISTDMSVECQPIYRLNIGRRRPIVNMIRSVQEVFSPTVKKADVFQSKACA